MSIQTFMRQSPRVIFGLILIGCVALLAFAYYAQYVWYMDPCPLCILQRIAFMVMGFGALLGLIHGSRGAARWLYVLVIWAGGVWGLITAGRHIWLQNLPPDQVPDCGPGFAFIQEQDGLAAAIRMAFEGTGDCSLISWQFLGLSMPGWTLVWYAVLMLLSLFALRRFTKD
ncbi:MAG: disulfide bond formation protein B [Pseudomonadota bacterium]